MSASIWATTTSCTPRALAQVIYGALQNGLIVARLFGAPERLESAADLLMASVSE